MRYLLIGTILMFVGQSMIWFQTNGQFVWPWFKRNPFILSLVFGTLISYLMIYGQRYIVNYFEGLLWPARFIGFGLGILSFSALTWFIMGEGITPKTTVSLMLAILLVGIQIFWK